MRFDGGRRVAAALAAVAAWGGGLSLLTKLTALAAAAALATIGVFWAAGEAVWEEVRDRHAGRIGGMVRLVTEAVLDNPTPESLARFARELEVGVRYDDAVAGWEFVSHDAMPSFAELRVTRRRGGGRRHAEEGGEGRHGHGAGHGGRLPRAFAIARDAAGGRYLLYERGGRRAAIGPADGDYAAAVLPALAAAALALLAVWGGMYALLRRQLKPLAALRRDMAAVGAGAWRECPITRRDEIGQLARGFNEMQARLRELMAARERFLMAASHELRSPIARLKLAVEMIDEAGARAALGGDLAELEAITGDLLDHARLRSPHAGLARRRVVVGAWVDALLDARRGDEGRVRRCFDEAAAACVLEVDDAVMRRAVGNLLDNALKYAARVWVRLEVADGADGRRRVALCVRDDGAGVREADLGRIFEPFFRGDESRTRGTGGFGLGLALVAAAVAAHGGEVRVVLCAVMGPGEGGGFGADFRAVFSGG